MAQFKKFSFGFKTQRDYYVNSQGQVISIGSNGDKRFVKGINNNGTIMVSVRNRNGNGNVLKSIGYMVLFAFKGKPPKKSMAAVHINGKKNDNRLSNLKWVTYAEMLSSIRRKLSDRDIKQLKSEYKSGKYPNKKLAKKYKISETHLYRVVKS